MVMPAFGHVRGQRRGIVEKEISVDMFIKTIKRLPSDQPLERPGIWYLTQKEHWLGWLGQYHGPGAYGRKTGVKHDARFAYNHIVCPELLPYLVRAIPLRPEIEAAAEKAYLEGSSLMQKSGAIRKAAPWSEIYQALWANQEPGLLERVRSYLDL